MVNEYQVGEYQLIDFGEEIKLQVMITKGSPWPVHGLLIESRRLHVTFAGGEDFPAWDDGESQFTLQERHDAVVTYEPSNADGPAKLLIGLGSNDLILRGVEQSDRLPLAGLLMETLAVHCRYAKVSQAAGSVLQYATILPDHYNHILENGGYALISTRGDAVIAVVFTRQRKAFKTDTFRDVFIGAIDGDGEMQVTALDHDRFGPKSDFGEGFEDWVETLRGM